MNVNNLKAKLVENSKNVDWLADEMGICRSSLYRKLSNFEKMTIGEAMKIKLILHLKDDEAKEIFLG